MPLRDWFSGWHVPLAEPVISWKKPGMLWQVLHILFERMREAGKGEHAWSSMLQPVLQTRSPI